MTCRLYGILTSHPSAFNVEEFTKKGSLNFICQRASTQHESNRFLTDVNAANANLEQGLVAEYAEYEQFDKAKKRKSTELYLEVCRFEVGR